MTHDRLYDISTRLLVAEVAFAVLFTLLLTASAAVGRWRRARHEVRCARGRDVVVRAITQAHERLDGIAEFAQLPWPVQHELVLDFGGSLTGAGLARLASLGLGAGVTLQAERRCDSRWWWRRLSGARVLTALDHDCAAMRRLLHDPDVVVRAQALVWAAGRSDQPVIDELVSRLADPERLCRFTVQDSLLRLGRPAASSLGRFLARRDQPGLVDGLAVARGLAQPALLEPILGLADHPNDHVRASVAAALGVLGGELAVQALTGLLDDTSPRARAAAARALGNIGSWQCCPTLLRLLGDTHWPVRRECALALRRMGGVGTLSLRRALHAENPFAADMARQVLDLPESVYHRVAS